LAIRLLWECEDHQLIARFMDVLRKDPDEHVQAAAANALGIFVYMGEMDKIPADDIKAIQNLLIEKFYATHPQIIRRRAIESLGYSSNPEVDDLIRKAYSEPDKKMVASALFAMGRSANEAWTDIVISNLQNANVDIQVEAVRAAGELELQSAREEILELLDDEGLDLEVFLAAVWSLSQIGGQGIQDKLEALGDDPDLDEETLDLIDSALENLVFNDSLGNLSLMDIDEDLDIDE
jgi:HEAT repeat protein